ncbi:PLASMODESMATA CALLOSE-BINDING PROTEIN 3-like [Amaranthus tricolor]|uniref:PLASMODESMATA CALLOSE-BINDING PROTEIN 3-like n=1 Tax=Amaranthus tricolor TaxID=29722 RepID=UPI00258491AF|nr:PLASMODESMATA CALLOSE-BINDING PROTEIN 3-like [Amaranthus tricolor]
MGKRVFLVQLFASFIIILSLFLCSVSSNVIRSDRFGEVPKEATVQKDITTPLTTVPTINFTATSTAPILNPNSIPDDGTWVPFATPTTSSPVNSGASWCVASQTAARLSLQMALDYACGHGGVDCSPIQPGGRCYHPNTLHDHASFAFNNYYQKNPIPNSCNFGGTAIVTSTNPSTQLCQYPSTSTSSSVLDTENQNISTVFGLGPPAPSSLATTLVNKIPYLSTSACFIVLLQRYVH